MRRLPALPRYLTAAVAVVGVMMSLVNGPAAIRASPPEVERARVRT